MSRMDKWRASKEEGLEVVAEEESLKANSYSMSLVKKSTNNNHTLNLTQSQMPKLAVNIKPGKKNFLKATLTKDLV